MEEVMPFSEVEEAYLDTLCPVRGQPKKVPEELRRAYALHLAVDRLPTLAPEKVCGLAADMEAYLKEGEAAGRGRVLGEARVFIKEIPDRVGVGG